MIDSTLDLALDYLTLYPARYVFPLKARDKFPPLIRDNLRQASNNFDQIRRWHDRWPGCNWALAHNMSDVLVADVDTKPGKVGESTLDLLAMLYGEWPETETNRSPSGGLHRVYLGKHIFTLSKHNKKTGEYIGGGFGEDIDSPHYTLIP